MWDWSSQFGLQQLSVQNSSGFLVKRIGSVVFLLWSSEKVLLHVYVNYFGSLVFEALTSRLTYQFLANLGAREDLLK